MIPSPVYWLIVVGKDLEETVEDAVPHLGIDLLREIHRPLQVGEEYSHLLSLALERATRREDLLGEVLRRIGAGVR
jgi:hypothetical protein